MAKITTLKTHYYKLPLDEVLVDAKHGNHSHFELIIAQVFDEVANLVLATLTPAAEEGNLYYRCSRKI
tara:strand:+ start:371 stop:574 length:204 start_codon:yes stop_codon:yes gene_type:complete